MKSYLLSLRVYNSVCARSMEYIVRDKALSVFKSQSMDVMHGGRPLRTESTVDERDQVRLEGIEYELKIYKAMNGLYISQSSLFTTAGADMELEENQRETREIIRLNSVYIAEMEHKKQILTEGMARRQSQAGPGEETADSREYEALTLELKRKEHVVEHQCFLKRRLVDIRLELEELCELREQQETERDRIAKNYEEMCRESQRESRRLESMAHELESLKLQIKATKSSCSEQEQERRWKDKEQRRNLTKCIPALRKVLKTLTDLEDIEHAKMLPLLDKQDALVRDTIQRQHKLRSDIDRLETLNKLSLTSKFLRENE